MNWKIILLSVTGDHPQTCIGVFSPVVHSDLVEILDFSKKVNSGSQYRLIQVYNFWFGDFLPLEHVSVIESS